MKKIGIYGEPGIGCHIDENGNKVYSKDVQDEFRLEQLKGDFLNKEVNVKEGFEFKPSTKIIFKASEKYFLNEQETKEDFSRLLRKAKKEVLNTPNLSLKEYLACFGEGFLRRLEDPQKMLHHSKNKIYVFIVTGENAPCGKGTLLGDYYSKSIYLESFNPFWARHMLELKDALINNYWQKGEEKLTEPKYKTIIIETKPEYVNRIKAEFFVLNAHPERDEEFIVNTVNFDRGW